MRTSASATAAGIAARPATCRMSPYWRGCQPARRLAPLGNHFPDPGFDNRPAFRPAGRQHPIQCRAGDTKRPNLYLPSGTVFSHRAGSVDLAPAATAAIFETLEREYDL